MWNALVSWGWVCCGKCMIGRLQIPPRRLLLSAAVSIVLASSAIAGETGHILVIKDSISSHVTIRKVPKAERKGGFFMLQSANGTTERLDAMTVGYAVDLSSFEPQNLDGLEDLTKAKTLESNTNAAVKKYPTLATTLAPYQATLRKEIVRAEAGEHKIGGKWLSAAKVAEMSGAQKSTVNRGTLHLKNGTTYENVDIIAASPKEIKIVHASGAATIPLSLVPEEFIKKNLTPDKSGATKHP